MDLLGKATTRIIYDLHRFKETREIEGSITNLVKRKTSAELSKSAGLLSIVSFEAELLATQTNDSRWKNVSCLKPDAGKLSVSEEATLIIGWLLILENADFQQHLGQFFGPK